MPEEWLRRSDLSGYGFAGRGPGSRATVVSVDVAADADGAVMVGAGEPGINGYLVYPAPETCPQHRIEVVVREFLRTI